MLTAPLFLLMMPGCGLNNSQPTIATIAVPVDATPVRCPAVSGGVRGLFAGHAPARPSPDTTAVDGRPAVSTRGLMKAIDERDAKIVELKQHGRQVIAEHDRCRRRAATSPGSRSS